MIVGFLMDIDPIPYIKIGLFALFLPTPSYSLDYNSATMRSSHA